jgi:tRNA dimethylallyltransferase
MNSLLAIVGPTGSGKTAKALQEAAKTDSIVVSADSRQVYRTMDIVTGKDHPKGVSLYGVDIVSPNESCSVAVWYEAVMPHIKQAGEERKQVIVVGGTGLYLRALTQGIETMSVPPNDELRAELSLLSLTELQEKLKDINPSRFTSMNHSDQHNQRRLIRAIEISSSNLSLNNGSPAPETTIIGLKYNDSEKYHEAVEMRVMSRLQLGAVEETKRLLSQYDRKLPSMSAIGYRSLIKYIEGKFSKEEMIAQWVADEIRYAKRQLTWFAKIPQIKWYDSGKGD